MALGPRLELRQTQTLVITPQLRQAIKLLHCNNVESASFVAEEIERNPLLEADEGGAAGPAPEAPAPDQTPLRPAESADLTALVGGGALAAPGAAPLDADFSNSYDSGGAGDGVMPMGRGGATDFSSSERTLEDLAEQPPSLRDDLAQQVRLAFADPRERMIGLHLIALLDGAGRLAAEPMLLAATLNCPLATVEAVRARMMRFEPAGLFARSLRECLAAQLAERDRLDPAMAMLLENLDLLARRELPRLREICGVDAEDLAEMIAEIRALDPKPGARGNAEPIRPLVPDVLVSAAPDGGWQVELNPQTLPRVLVNHRFHARVLAGAKPQERAWLTERMQSATWLARTLEQRAETILKVAAEIVRRQDGFLRHGIAHLRPLILRDIAAAVEMHESTVSRVAANKALSCPRGLFELKYFFTTAIGGTDGESHSSETVRHRIRALIAAESAADVLSDDAIVAALRREGVDIARRTVAKYREALRIPNSVQRKREKAVPA